MIFHRSTPKRVYKTYTGYRQQLRRDFTNLCAYCFRHEKHFGGVANGQIDHFYPETECKKSGREDLISTYGNLFWSCGECNNTKHEAWPSLEEEELGYRFVNTTTENSDMHWKVLPNGHLRELTKAGEYTIGEILLWRDDLVRWRREVFEARKAVERLKRKIADSNLSSDDRNEFRTELSNRLLFLHPLPIDRPQKRRRRWIKEVLPIKEIPESST